MYHIFLIVRTGDFATFRSTVVRPIQRSFAARKELQSKSSDQHRAFHLEQDGSKQKAAALSKFHQAIELSAEGLNLLRKLHKQVTVPHKSGQLSIMCCYLLCASNVIVALIVMIK